MTFDTFLALGTIALQVGILITLIAWVAKAPFATWVAAHSGVLLRFIFTAAMLGSLIYSEIYDFAPCILCWYQRLAIFPIAFLSYTSNLAKSALLRLQVLILASAGFAVSLYHNYTSIQRINGVCGADGVSCNTLYVFEFGYITIPMMAVTLLAAGILLSLLASSKAQK